MKECALCRQAARMYCSSDRASLCFECDAKVHGANFLVARHTRCLLCRACQEPTPWKASGSRLGPTVSVCHKCVGGGCREREGTDEVRRVDHNKVEDGQEEEGQEMGVETESEEDDDYDYDDDGEEEEEDDGENQVVPLSIAGEAPPPATSCSSSSEESSSGCVGGYSTKRKRGDYDHGESQGGQGCCSPSPYSRYLAAETEASSRWSRFARDDHLLGGGKPIGRSHISESGNPSPPSI